MKKIYKYKLDVCDKQKVVLPIEAQILKAGMQGSCLYIWALVDPDEKSTMERTICIFGTGHEVAGNVDDLVHIETIFVGDLVFHIFESFE